VGKPVLDSEAIMQRGLIIRHLMLPGLLFDTKKVLDYIMETYGDSVYVSLMNQYTPMHRANQFPGIDKSLNKRHYESIIQYCLDSGMHNAFIQDPGTATEDYVPDFNLSGI
jgi:putative pyruvate formate lyase activating enzyme